MLTRTRFAPSPTGYLHIGGLRTALFAYLFAKQQSGKFILRIEDTDQARLVLGAAEDILKNLELFGIKCDESFKIGGEFAPYVQSQRIELYQKYVKTLLDKEVAYHCFCSNEKLEKMRQEQIKKKLAPKYDGSCRGLAKDLVEKYLKEGREYVVRMKINHSRILSKVKDLLKGEVVFKVNQLDDAVILKSDGFPTYHLACVVDDHLMKISHVIRGEEWLPSTPKHLQLYEYFGWQPPSFIHLPLLLAPDRSKLSKRHGDLSAGHYLKQGFLAECLINFIALLGWNPGSNREIFSMQELIKEFSIKKLSKSGAIFDLKKLQWMNQQYIKSLDKKDLFKQLEPFLDSQYKNIDEEKLEKMVFAIRDGLQQLNQINQKMEVFFQTTINSELTSYIENETAKKIFVSLLENIKKITTWNGETFLQSVKAVQNEVAVKGKELWIPLRIALTNSKDGPELPLMAEIYGKEDCIKKLESLIA